MAVVQGPWAAVAAVPAVLAVTTPHQAKLVEWVALAKSVKSLAVQWLSRAAAAAALMATPELNPVDPLAWALRAVAQVVTNLQTTWLDVVAMPWPIRARAAVAQATRIWVGEAARAS